MPGGSAADQSLPRRPRSREVSSNTSLPYACKQPAPDDPLEAFPLYMEQLDEIDAVEDLHEEHPPHCMIHCKHNVCKRIFQTLGNKARSALSCHCSVVAPPEQDPSASTTSPEIGEADIETAMNNSGNVSGDEILTITLPDALTLTHQMLSLGALDIGYHIEASPHFRPSTLYDSRDYTQARQEASRIVRHLLEYFALSLGSRPRETRTISVQALEKEIQDFMRLELVCWMCRWCLPKHKDLREYYGEAVTMYVKGHYKPGVSMLRKVVEALVREFVAVLAWSQMKQHEES